MRHLEGQNIDYEWTEYPPTLKDATKVAAALKVSDQRVFKTLVVVRRTGKPILAMLPADRKLDLKKLAKAAGEKKVSMATHSEAESLTRLRVGGISAIALVNKGFEVYLDCSATVQEKIFISAGEPGIQLQLRPADLVKVTNARLADVIE